VAWSGTTVELVVVEGDVENEVVDVEGVPPFLAGVRGDRGVVRR
jgi:hypothetical protein